MPSPSNLTPADISGEAGSPASTRGQCRSLGSQLWRHLPLVMAVRRVDGVDAAANTANATFVVGLLHTALCEPLGDDGRSNQLAVLESVQSDAQLRELALELVLLLCAGACAAPALQHRAVVVLQLCTRDAATLLQPRARGEKLLRAVLHTLHTPQLIGPSSKQGDGTTAAATLILGMHCASVRAGDATLVEAAIEEKFRELLGKRLASCQQEGQVLGAGLGAGPGVPLQNWLDSERTLQSVASPASRGPTAAERSSPPPPFQDGTPPSLCSVGALQRFVFANLAPRYTARPGLVHVQASCVPPLSLSGPSPVSRG